MAQVRSSVVVVDVSVGHLELAGPEGSLRVPLPLQLEHAALHRVEGALIASVAIIA